MDDELAIHRHDFRSNTIDVVQQLWRENFRWLPICNDTSLVEQNKARAMLCRKAQLMQ